MPQPGEISAGFEAIVQCDSYFLQVQLTRNLREAGVEALTCRVDYDAGGFPPAFQAVLAEHLRPDDFARPQDIYVELRMLEPRLVSIQSGPAPSRPDDVVIVSEFSADDIAGGGPSARREPPVALAWRLEINLLRVALDLVISVDPGSGGGGTTPTTEQREVLGHGRVITQMPAHLVTREDLLQAWIELDVAAVHTTVQPDGAPAAALVASARGREMVQTALAALTSRSGLRLSPRVAIAGNSDPHRIARMGLAPMQVTKATHVHPDGREVLSLCVNFGAGGAGSVARVQPFLGTNHFGYYASLVVIAPLLRERWKMQPALLQHEGDVIVEMPLNENSDETGEGRARLTVQLRELRSVGLMAVEGNRDDVLRLTCEQMIQLLRLWWPDGREVENLGELGEPALLPFAANNALFTPRSDEEAADTPFRRFLKFLVEPLARPLVEPFDIVNVNGLSSEALSAIVVRWSIHFRRPEGPATPVGGGGSQGNSMVGLL